MNERKMLKRKILQEIQPAVNNKQINSQTSKRKFGNSLQNKPAANGKKLIKPLDGPLKIYQDENALSAGKRVQKGSDKACQTDEADFQKKKTPEEEAFELMCQDPAPESYWEELAEQRRLALAETLLENKELYGENALLREENISLKENLKEAKDSLESQAAYYSIIIKSLSQGCQTEACMSMIDDASSQSDHPATSADHRLSLENNVAVNQQTSETDSE